MTRTLEEHDPGNVVTYRLAENICRPCATSTVIQHRSHRDLRERPQVANRTLMRELREAIPCLWRGRYHRSSQRAALRLP